MKITKTEIDGVLIMEPEVSGDHRGWFSETYSKSRFAEAGLDIEFVQDNHSMSTQKGTLRGLHFQIEPKAQTKLVHCTRGKVMDVAVDIRKGSTTYKKWITVELSEDNRKQLLLPRGIAHGILTLTDNAEIQYKVDAYYSQEYDRAIRYDDPAIGVDWGITFPILSEKDKNAPLLLDSDANFSLRFMVTGAKGQLGYDIAFGLKAQGLDVIAPERDEFDLTDTAQVRGYIHENRPDVIIHCAAYTNVDKAEEEKALCYSINAEGTKTVAEAAKEIGARLAYISTDYVFDGLGEMPSTEEKETNPVNYYGYTKESGEQMVKASSNRFYIIRTSWLYGSNGDNFVKKMLKLAKTNQKISVVDDQIGAPTYTKDLADFIVALVQTDKYGIYHGVNEGYCSWYEFAKYIFENSGMQIEVAPVLTKDYPQIAKRPLNSRLLKDNTDKSGIARLPHWKDALSRYLSELQR